MYSQIDSNCFLVSKLILQCNVEDFNHLAPLTCVFLLSQLATWRWWILEAAYPLVLHLQNASCDAGVVLVIVAPKDVVCGKLIDYILHDLRRDLKAKYI